MNKLYPSRLSRRFGADPVTPESHTQTNSLAGIRHKELIILSHSAEGLWVLVPWASQGRHLQPGSHQQPDEHSPRPCNSLSLLSRSFSPVFQHCKAAAQLLLLLPFSMATRPVPETNWGVNPKCALFRLFGGHFQLETRTAFEHTSNPLKSVFQLPC